MLQQIKRRTFQGTELRGRDLSRVELVDCTFRDCDLSGTDFAQTSHTRSTFYRCAALDEPVDFDQAVLADSSFEGCELPRAILRKADLTGVRMVSCDLTAARLTGCIFDRADLREVQLPRALMDQCSFVGAHLEGIQFRPARSMPFLRGVRFFRSCSSRTIVRRRIELDPTARGPFATFCHRESFKDGLFAQVADLDLPKRPIALSALVLFGLTTDFGCSFVRWLLTTSAVILAFSGLRLALGHSEDAPTAISQTVRAFVLQTDSGTGALDLTQILVGIVMGAVLCKMGTDLLSASRPDRRS